MHIWHYDYAPEVDPKVEQGFKLLRDYGDAKIYCNANRHIWENHAGVETQRGVCDCPFDTLGISKG